MRGLDLALRAGEALGHRGLLHQERRGDLGDGQSAEQAQGERDPGLHRKRGVAAGEHQPEPVVVDRTRGRGVVVLGEHVCRLVLGVAMRLAAQSVDGLARGGGGQPAAGVGRYAVDRPPLDRGDERLGRCVLGDVEVPEAAGETGDHPRPLVPVRAGDRLLGLVSGLVAGKAGHGSSSALKDSSVWNGRTSTLPRHALEPSAARASAWSRSAASITQNPPRYSLLSR